MNIEVRTNRKAAGEIRVARDRENRVALVTPDLDGSVSVSTRVWIGTSDSVNGVLIVFDRDGRGTIDVYAGHPTRPTFRAKIAGARVEILETG